MSYVLIDPHETLDYTCDWSIFLDDGGSPSDTVTASSWEVSPVSEDSPSEPVLSGATNTTNSTTVFISNCREGAIYTLTSRIQTLQGRTADRSIVHRMTGRVTGPIDRSVATARNRDPSAGR